MYRSPRACHDQSILFYLILESVAGKLKRYKRRYWFLISGGREFIRAFYFEPRIK